jgi:hypothetical protein
MCCLLFENYLLFLKSRRPRAFYPLIVKTKAIYSSEKSVELYLATQRNNPREGLFHKKKVESKANPITDHGGL